MMPHSEEIRFLNIPECQTKQAVNSVNTRMFHCRVEPVFHSLPFLLV